MSSPTSSVAASDDEAMSPKNHLKFLCSYGGKILPRPTDGQLKYVGGETRALNVLRSTPFAALKEKINGMFNAEVVIKYQMMPEDLDALISVRTDEDLSHMLDEYDRHEQLPRSPTSSGTPRFRLYLFPSSASPHAPPDSNNLFPSSASPHAPPDSNNRYLDALNGSPIFTLSSSASTSPTNTIDMMATLNPAAVLGVGLPRPGEGRGMHRVRSSPNLGGASQQSQMASSGAVASPRFLHRHLQPKHFTGYGMYNGGGGGQRRGPGAEGFRYDVCGCGCGCPISVQQQQQMMMRRYFYQGTGGGPGGGCMCWGHGGGGDDGGMPKSGLGFHSSGVPPPPRKPSPFEQ